MDRKRIRYYGGWVFSIAAFVSLALGGALLSVIVGDWVFLHTGELWLGWLVGIFVAVAFLVSLGVAIGAWFWVKSEPRPVTKPNTIVGKTVDQVMREARQIPRD